MEQIHKFYTGIGSRETPPDILDLITAIALYLSNKGYILRSGGANGADSAFERGSRDKKEIFLPWKGFNKSKNPYINIPKEAYTIAAKFHPVWDKLRSPVKNLHARNVMQVLGRALRTPSDFLICWTKGGQLIGGTAQALRIAMEYKIPIFNLAIENIKQEFRRKIGYVTKDKTNC
jgi:hypothetical protein